MFLNYGLRFYGEISKSEKKELVELLLEICKKNIFSGIPWKTILGYLLDTGVEADQLGSPRAFEDENSVSDTTINWTHHSVVVAITIGLRKSSANPDKLGSLG